MKIRLNDLFDQMDDEKGNKLDDKIEVEKDNDTAYLLNILSELNDSIVADNAKNLIEFLDTKILKKYSSTDISKLSCLLKDDLVGKSQNNAQIGLFFSYLINNSEDDNHILYFQNNKITISSIGWKNTKNITIHGGVKNSTGERMSDGKLVLNGNSMHYPGFLMSGGEIIIRGDSSSQAGALMEGGKMLITGSCNYGLGADMKGGLIEVEQNCEIYAAKSMKNGKIIVRGNAGCELGLLMEGGAIEVYGEIDSLSRHIKGGNIYHKDKQIVRNGEILDRSYKVE